MNEKTSAIDVFYLGVTEFNYHDVSWESPVCGADLLKFLFNSSFYSAFIAFSFEFEFIN
jgi:hypothetical protein